MKKTVILALLLILPSVTAITLTVPQQREMFFEPNGLVSVQYYVGNPDPMPMNVRITINAGPLRLYVREPQQIFTIPSSSSQAFNVELLLPEELKSGLYPIRIEAEEVSLTGGMSAVTGATDVVSLISPFEQGFPYGSIYLDQHQPVGGAIKFAVYVQNIGKTYLDKLQPQAGLKQDGKLLKSTFTNTIPPLAPFAKNKLQGVFDTEGLEPGYYEFSMPLGVQELTQKIAYGRPVIKVLAVPELKAAQTNNFTANIRLENWNTPIIDANIRMRISNLLSSEKKATLVPGDNILDFSAEAAPGKSGTYFGKTDITGELVRVKADFQTQVEGSAGTGGIGFKAGQNAEVEVETPEEQSPAQASTPTSKNTILLIGLLIASLVLFSFALGQYLARRKAQPPIVIQYEQPKPPA